MSEQCDTDDSEDDIDTEPADPTDRITSQQSTGTEIRRNKRAMPAPTTLPWPNLTGERDETNRAAEPREDKSRDLSNAEQLQAAAAQVSHDLKSQLTVAHGRLDLVRQEVDNDNLVKMATTLNRMETLIDDLGAESAACAEVIDFERVPLSTLVDQCWQNVAASKATLHNKSTLALQADPNSLKRVLENLFQNAVEHNGADVRVEVGDLNKSDGFYVADDGDGILENVCSSVFEPGVSTECNGSGLGLSIVAQIVNAHSWQIRVSESDAGGARFEITGVQFAE